MQTKGFTLIELMIVVAIVAILSAIAYPSYQQHVRRASADIAKSWLMEIASTQSRYFVNMRDYGTLSAVGMASAPSDVDEYYTISLVEDKDCAGSASSPGFCVSATPISGTRQAGMATLQVDHKGNQLPAAAWDN